VNHAVPADLIRRMSSRRHGGRTDRTRGSNITTCPVGERKPKSPSTRENVVILTPSVEVEVSRSTTSWTPAQVVSTDRARHAVDAAVVEGRSLRSVASSLDMSKSWVAKQVCRFHAGGYEALAPRSKAPHRRPSQISTDVENEIVALREQLAEEGFDAGPLTIQYHLRQRHGTSPGRSTINRALTRRGFVVPQPQATRACLDVGVAITYESGY
jgi:transposase